MATKASRSAARFMMAPAVVLLLGWMLVPLTMTLYFSFKQYLPLRGDSLERGLDWVGFDNYARFISSSAFWPSVQTTLIMVGGVLVITVVLGVLLAMLLNQPIWGQGIVRILVIAPFFVMPTVSALVWKNMLMDPVNGIFAHLWRFFGAEPVSWLSDASLQSIILIASWQWLPFATLILLTAIQSLDSEQLEAAEMDGAPPACALLVPRVAAPVARHHHCDPDPDDLLAVHLCRDLRDHRWGLWHPHAHLPHLPTRR
jgi:sorbitol/mannitol transport system permease protein